MKIEVRAKVKDYFVGTPTYFYFGTSVCDLLHAACYWNFMPDVMYEATTVIKKFNDGIDELNSLRKDYSLWSDEDVAIAANIMKCTVDMLTEFGEEGALNVVFTKVTQCIC